MPIRLKKKASRVVHSSHLRGPRSKFPRRVIGSGKLSFFSKPDLHYTVEFLVLSPFLRVFNSAWWTPELWPRVRQPEIETR
jgi:hypothetical protein